MLEKKRRLLDSFALIAFLGKEKGFEKVKRLLEAASAPGEAVEHGGHGIAVAVTTDPVGSRRVERDQEDPTHLVARSAPREAREQAGENRPV